MAKVDAGSFVGRVTAALLGPAQPGINVDPIIKAGRAPDGSTSSFVDIWSDGTLRNLQTAGSQIVVSSSSANDDFSGSGAQQVLVRALDSSFNEQNVLLNLAGTGSVNSGANDFIRINEAVVVATGAGGKNDGTITVTLNGTNQAIIPASFNISNSTMYTVPKGKILLVHYLTVGGDEVGDVELKPVFHNASNNRIPVTLAVINAQNGRPLDFLSEQAPFVFDETDDFRLTARHSGNKAISCYWRGLLYDRAG